MPVGIARKTLSNGLTVMLKEIHTAPLASVWIWYHVGSRHEIPGITGASHWVEHMQFKGTPKHPNATLDKTISRLGGYWNAMTYLDWTTYFATVPAEHVNLILSIEADRMSNSLFEEEHVASERTVVISERQGNENNPGFLLTEQVRGAAFRVHPYGHQVIGELADLQAMDRAALYRHYRLHYQPGNAVLAVAGAFEYDKILARIEELYGGIPNTPPPVLPERPEPDRRGEHRVQVEGPGDTTFFVAAYPAPAGNHPDFLSLLVLDSLLSGPSNLNMFSGGISNKTSRLYQALVETNLAISASGYLEATVNPYLYQIIVTLGLGKTSSPAIAAIDEQIALLKSEPPSTESLQRAVKQARALFAYGSESITNQAYWLGFAEMFADYGWFEGYLDRLAEVTPQDVQRIAEKYLDRKRRVLGTFRPYQQEAAE